MNEYVIVSNRQVLVRFIQTYEMAVRVAEELARVHGEVAVCRVEKILQKRS